MIDQVKTEQRKPKAHHCITCSDEALPATVVSVDEGTGVAVVKMGNEVEEVDVMLLESIAAGDLLLVHGGVALTNLGKQ